MKIFYKVLSYLTHPLFLTSYLASLYFVFLSTDHTISITDSAYRSIVINTLVFPLLTVLLLKGLGFIDSIYLRTKRERIIPTIASMTFYFWAYFVARHAPFDHALQVLLLAGFINLILLVLLGILMKPSLHLSSWAVGSLWLLHLCSQGYTIFWGIFFASFVLMILVAIARYKLGAHDSKELLAGLVCGIISMLLSTILI